MLTGWWSWLIQLQTSEVFCLKHSFQTFLNVHDKDPVLTRSRKWIQNSQTQPHLKSLHVHNLVPDPLLQGGQGLQLRVDLYLHIIDVLTQILGQSVIVVVAPWLETFWSTFCLILKELMGDALESIQNFMDVNTLTRIQTKFLLQVVVSLHGHLVCWAEFGLVLVQEVSDLFDLLQQVDVMFVHQTLNPAPRWTFWTLLDDRRERMTRAGAETELAWQHQGPYPVVIAAEGPLLLWGTLFWSGVGFYRSSSSWIQRSHLETQVQVDHVRL